MSIYRDRPTGVLIPLLLAAGLLATACSSTPAKSTSHVIPTSCGTPTACLAAARTEGFHGTVLVPANAPVTDSGGHYDTPKTAANWTFEFSYRERVNHAPIQEAVLIHGTSYLNPKCFSPGQAVASPLGPTVCVSIHNQDREAIFFTPDGTYYQFAESLSSPPSRLLAVIADLAPAS